MLSQASILMVENKQVGKFKKLQAMVPEVVLESHLST